MFDCPEHKITSPKKTLSASTQPLRAPPLLDVEEHSSSEYGPSASRSVSLARVMLHDPSSSAVDVYGEPGNPSPSKVMLW